MIGESVKEEGRTMARERMMQDPSKLPKWARFRLAKLEADVEDYHQKLAELSGDAETNTFMGHLWDKVNRQPLPKDEIIFFYLGDSSLRVRVKGNYIELNGSGNIIIMPRASNAAQISFE